MALTLLNYFFWEIPDAKVPFVIADAVVLVALGFVERGMKAESKLRALEAEHAQQNHQMDKAAKHAQDTANRFQQRSKNNKNGKKSNNNNNNKNVMGGNGKGNRIIQQPSKRD